MDVPRDTDLDAYRLQVAIYRRMGPADRVTAMFRLNDLARKLAAAGIRSRHPDYDDDRVHRALARLFLGDEVVRQVWPDRELVEP